MLKFTTGNLLESTSDCLVNTVNCEGYMGKGIAYQFKLRFPNNNKSYVKACKNKTLTVGKLHHFKEDGKIIINFPTKDKWRQKSKTEYIIDGLNELVRLIPQLNIQSISIPPLGCGNGGLKWEDIKPIIIEKLRPLENKYTILVYEPYKNYSSIPKNEPKLYLSHLILMNIKFNLNKFSSLRLQKTCFFLNIFLEESYFKFIKYKYGPYDNTIPILSKDIKEFQGFHNVKNTREAYEIAYKTLISKQYDEKINYMKPFIYKACQYVNNIPSNETLECISTVLYLIQNYKIKDEEHLVLEFKNWSEDKAKRFTEEDIKSALLYLMDTSIVIKTLIGYEVNKFK